MLNCVLSGLNIRSVPAVSNAFPNLNAPLRGVATWSDEGINGKLLSDIRIFEERLPLDIDFGGDFSQLEFAGLLGDSSISMNYGNNRLEGLLQLERFPIHLLAEASVGATDVMAEATGVLRADIPFSDLGSSNVRVFSERVTLERQGSRIDGNISAVYSTEGLVIEEARFKGIGEWNASGIITPDALDFSLDATDSDFTALLGLVPRLAAINLGAQGSLNVRATGSLRAPSIEASSPSLAVNIGGTQYQMDNVGVMLEGSSLMGEADVLAISPIIGSFDVTTTGSINLFPYALNSFDIDFSGGRNSPECWNNHRLFWESIYTSR